MRFSFGKLFTSLKHGDPQAVALTAVVVFCVSVGWFAWTLLNPQLTENLPLGTGADRREAPTEDVRLSSLIEEQQTADIPDSVPNPFYRSPPERRQRRPTGNQNQTNNQNSDDTKDPEKPEEPEEPEKPKPPPPPPEPTTRPVDITFHGMLIRPDGAKAALISTSDDPRQRFLAIGDSLPGPFTIGSITSGSLELQSETGTPEHFERGKTRTLEIPK